ncbi:MAG: Dabb family protein [Spongiibacteraceae bacterium]
MIRHIVLLKIKDGVEGLSKAESMAKGKALVEGMNGKIPGLIKAEAGIDFLRSDASADMVVYAELESREALSVYANHPVHLEVLAYLKTIISERQVADYEC